MDLSNLSSNLPPSIPVTQSQLNELDTKLTNEFKSAANSVAALYRLSNSKSSLLRYKGYLDCLDDLLNLIKLHKWKSAERRLSRQQTNGPSNNSVDSSREQSPVDEEQGDGNHDANDAISINGFDIENWCLTKKAELMGGENINEGLLFNEKDISESQAGKAGPSYQQQHHTQSGFQREEQGTHGELRNSSLDAKIESQATHGVHGESDMKTDSTLENVDNAFKELPEEFEFSMDHPVNQKFCPAMPLLSVERTPRANKYHGGKPQFSDNQGTTGHRQRYQLQQLEKNQWEHDDNEHQLYLKKHIERKSNGAFSKPGNMKVDGDEDLVIENAGSDNGKRKPLYLPKEVKKPRFE